MRHTLSQKRLTALASFIKLRTLLQSPSSQKKELISTSILNFIRFPNIYCLQPITMQLISTHYTSSLLMNNSLRIIPCRKAYNLGVGESNSKILHFTRISKQHKMYDNIKRSTSNFFSSTTYNVHNHKIKLAIYVTSGMPF